MSTRAIAASAIIFLLTVILLAPPVAGDAASPELQATAGIGYVDLNWNAVDDADGYTIYRLGDGGLQRLVNVTVPFTSYHDTNVEEGGNYVYCVTAWQELNESAPSNTVSVTVLAEEDVPVLPILAIVLSIIAVQVCIVMLLYFSKLKMQLK